MLESIVNQENHDSEDQRSYQDQQCRILQLFPGGPSDLLGELLCGLFKIVNELSHLCLQWTLENWKRESGVYG